MAEFEQSMSVLAAIKKILTDYPYGNAVLLELLQNADDAEAKHVTAQFESFTANEDHPAARSPALVFHNSATFTERDLSNLKSFGTQEETSKRNDASKVGRFGIGFNSSFHVSDVVAFVTGDNLVVFDPAKENLPLSSKGDKIGGMHWRISSLGTDGVYTEDQKNYALRVLEAFEQSGLGFKKEEYYQGTIFRLPLRKAPSTLWKEVHRPVDIANLLVRFFDIVSLGMVMLKHVVKIEACIHRKSPQEPIETLFSVLSAQKENLNLKPWLKNYTESIALVKSETDKINAGNLDSYSYGKEKQVVRQKVMKSLPEPQHIIRDISVTLQKTSLFVPYEKIVTGKHTTDISFQAALDATNAHPEGQEVNTMVKFQIAHQLGPGNGWQKSKVWEISSTNAQNGHAVDVPWGAAIVNMKTNTEKGSRLMCFFPIGGEIQLPVNIHGCFKVSSDRQSIKHISDEWNNALATEVIPYAYVQVLAAIKEKKGADYYQLFPTLDYTDGMSLHIAGEFVKLLRDPSLSPPLIAQQNGQWGKLQNVRFPFLRDPYHKPSETHAVAIHCLLVASAEAKRGQLPLATFPHFSLTKPPSAAQINQLDAVAKLFSANTLAPLEVCQFMREMPIDAARLFLSNAAGIATDLFWMCTKGANTNAAKYYLQLPVIPLAHCPPHNMAFVDSVPKQLLTASSINFISSPLTDDTSINVNQCIVCRTPESLALAMEAFPQKIVKTKEDSAESDCGLQPTHLLDQKYQKLLGIREISVKDLCNRLQLAISHGPLIWRKKSSDDPDGEDSITWKLENDETKLSISLANINNYLKQVQKADQGSLSQLATIPFLPVRTRGSTAAANDSNGNEQRLSTSLLHTHQKDIKCFRVVSEEKDAKLAEHLSNQEIGIEIDFSMIDSSVVSSMGRFAKLDGSGTLSLIKTNLRNPIHAEFAQSLVAHLSAWTAKIKESNDAQETLQTLPIFKTVGDRLCKATDVVLRPPQLPEILGEVCASVPGAAKKIQSLFANQQILSVVGYELAREENSAILETIFNTKRMNLSDFWAAAAVLSADVSSQAEVGTVGYLIFQELIKSLLQANINLPSLGQKLQAKSLFVDKWGPINPSVAILHASNHISEDTETLLQALMEVEEFKNRIPRLVIFPPIPLSKKADLSKVSKSLGIAAQFGQETLEIMASALVRYMVQQKKIEYGLVRALLRIINKIATLQQPNAISAEVLEKLKKIRFIPALNAGEFLQTRSAREKPQGRLSCPSECVEEKVFVTCPSAFQKCVHPDVIPEDERDSFVNTFNLFGWTKRLKLEIFLNASEKACEDHIRRHQTAEPLESRPPEFDEFYMNHLYSEIEKQISQAPPAIMRIYFPEIDAVGSKKNMSTDPKAQNLHPILIYVDKRTFKHQKLLSLIKVNEGTVEDIIDAINSIPYLKCPSQNAAATTIDYLDDQQKELFLKALSYLVRTLPVGASLDVSLSKKLLVPTSDGKCNYAFNTYYEHTPDDTLQEGSNTILWNKVPSAYAKMLGIRHMGFHALSTNNQMRLIDQNVADYIKNTLRIHNRPNSVLWEMLKYVDRLGAHNIEFILDERTHSSRGDLEEYFGTGMKDNQLGQALTIKFDVSNIEPIENFAESLEKNESSYSYYGQSQRKRERESTGVGINSMFYVTDCPSIVSSRSLLVLDPAYSNIDSRIAPRGKPGIKIDHVENKSIVKRYQSQLKPFEEVQFGTEYKGTIIRLPLRKNGESGALHSQKVTVSEVAEWFLEFKRGFKDTLLFLSSIENVQLSRKGYGTQNESIFHSSIDNVQEMRTYRSEIATLCPRSGPNALPSNSAQSRRFTPVATILNKLKVTNCNISHSTRGNKAFKLCTFSDTSGISPSTEKWCTAAILLDPQTGSPIPNADGGLYNIVPIGDEPKLPFNVDANFAEDNFITKGESGQNKCLKDIVPKCLVGCMTLLKGFSWEMWPNMTNCASLAKCTLLEACVHHDAAIFPTDENKFTSLQDGVFCNKDSATSTTSSSEMKVVRAFMKTVQTPIFELDSPYYLAVKNIVSPKELCPSTVVDALEDVAANQKTVPFTALCDSPNFKTLDQKFVFLKILRNYVSPFLNGNIVGLPLVLVKTGDVAVVSRENPCYRLPTNVTNCQKLFTTLCPHLGEQNIIYFDYCSEPNFCRVLSSSALVSEFPTIASIKGYEFLQEECVGRDFRWNAGSNSIAKVWLESLWELIYAEASCSPNFDIKSLKPFEGFPLVPVWNREGKLLRPISKRDTITNGSQGPSVLEELISKLNIEYIDSSFSMSAAIVSILKIESASLSSIIERSAKQLEIFNEFTDDERDSLRRIMLAEKSQPLPDSFRKLPIFKVFRGPTSLHPSGRVVRSGIENVSFCIPSGAPLTSICVDFAVENVQQEYSSNGRLVSREFVKQLSSEDFLYQCFFPKLGKLTLTEEMANWRFAGGITPNGRYPSPKLSPTLPLTVPLSLLHKTKGHPRESLTEELLRYMYANGLIMDSFDQHPTLNKYREFSIQIALNSVSVSLRTSEYILPLVDRCQSKPISGFLNKLHQCLSDLSLVSVHPMPLPLAADKDVSSGICKFIKQRSTGDALTEIIDCYIELMNSEDQDERQYLSSYFTGNREVANVNDTLAAISLTMVLELDQRDFTYQQLPIYCCEAYDEEVTAELSQSVPLNANSCPSAFYSISSEPFHGSISGVRILEDCVPYSMRWLCWTQVPLLHPLLENIMGTRAPTVDEVILHIQEIVKNAPKLGPKILSTALEHCYVFLTEETREAEARIPLDVPICALPLNNFGETICVPINVIVSLESVQFPDRRKTSLTPYFYTVDDFIGCAKLLALVNAVKERLELPRPDKVLAAIHSAVEDYAHGMRNAHFKLKYEGLIRMLLASCNYHDVAVELANGVDPQRSYSTRKGPKTRDSVTLSGLLVPHWKSQDMLCIEEACAPDDEGLLQKISPSAKITSLSVDLCMQLRIPSMAQRITESPLSYTEITSSSTSQSLPPEDTIITAGQLTKIITTIDHLNVFLTSDAFGHALARVLNTNRLKRGDTCIIDPLVVSTIKDYRIVLVSDLQTHMSDNQYPEEIIFTANSDLVGSTDEAAISVLHRSERLILVDVAAMTTAGIPLQFVISKEINVLLGGQLDTSPLAAVFAKVNQPSVNFDTILNYLGCLPSE